MFRKAVLTVAMVMVASSAFAQRSGRPPETRETRERTEQNRAVEQGSMSRTQQAVRADKSSSSRATLETLAKNDKECGEVCGARIEAMVAPKGNLSTKTATKLAQFRETTKSEVKAGQPISAALEKGVSRVSFTEAEKEEICGK